MMVMNNTRVLQIRQPLGLHACLGMWLGGAVLALDAHKLFYVPSGPGAEKILGS